MLDKTEWPNEAKLKRLREEGVVPLSLFSCRCVGSVAFLFTLWMLRARIAALGIALREVYNAGVFSHEAARLIASETARLVVTPLAVCAVVIVLWGLLQSRFLFRFGLVALNFQRLTKVHFPNPVGLFMRMFGAVALALILIAVGLLSARLCWTGVLYLLNNDRLYLGSWAPAVAQALLVPASLLLGVMALLGWLLSKFLFLAQHRMSRTELEREIFESDVAL